MKRSSYLRVCGVIELIGFGVGLISFLFSWFTDKLVGIETWAAIVILLVIIFFGPSMGILFLTMADVYDTVYELAEDKEERDAEKQEEPTFKFGELVVVEKEYTKNDGTVIPVGTIGVVDDIEPETLFIKCTINGETVFAPLSYDGVSKLKKE